MLLAVSDESIRQRMRHLREGVSVRRLITLITDELQYNTNSVCVRSSYNSPVQTSDK